MPARAKRDVEAALKKKGFQQDDGDHHWFFYWTSDGKKTTVRTKTSHGSTKDLGDGLLKEMARQVRIAKVQFLNLVDCPMSREQYQELLEEGVHVKACEQSLRTRAVPTTRTANSPATLGSDWTCA